MARMATAVRASLRTVTLTAADRGAAELAVHYALAIDADPDTLDVLGPKLLAALESLGMTPRARRSLVRGVNDASSPLDELHARRRHRGLG